MESAKTAAPTDATLKMNGDASWDAKVDVAKIASSLEDAANMYKRHLRFRNFAAGAVGVAGVAALGGFAYVMASVALEIPKVSTAVAASLEVASKEEGKDGAYTRTTVKIKTPPAPPTSPPGLLSD